ncbi:MAG: thiamine phosphate synthase [Opitutales bacterium]|nr:thiamine phosphate synthase [Opitutales bacterium]
MPDARTLDLLVITPPEDLNGETDTLVSLVEAGLTAIHVRKPHHRPADLEKWLTRLPPLLRPHTVVHGPPEMARGFALAGWHERDRGLEPFRPSPPDTPLGLRSGAVHTVEGLRSALDAFDRVLFSPVYPSISKPGYGPTEPAQRKAVSTLLKQGPCGSRRARVFALGGITPDKLDQLRSWGFDGGALLGAIWLSPDPVAAFLEFQKQSSPSPVSA